MLDLSVIAFCNDEPLGFVWVVAADPVRAVLSQGRSLAPCEKLNFLGIGTREAGRGRGLAMATASLAYLELVRCGAEHVGYGEVLDDNWASRRTAQKLGGTVRGNRMSYRRELAP
jgi:hypothetical protein